MNTLKRQSKIFSKVFDLVRGKQSIEELQDMRADHDCKGDSCDICLKIDEMIDGQIEQSQLSEDK